MSAPISGPRSARVDALLSGLLLAALGIALGAFGAHALKARLDPAMLANFETGVRYQMYAALALIALSSQTNIRRAPVFLLAGAVIFSGTLYVLALTGQRWLGAITPIGGALLIAGFVVAAVEARGKGV
ncbi:DUF423 domain-containing protein [Deinococcus sp. Arct2-2]|uniref:DUF423 domain-containing protein n=1 Tax=Deinococcus sp. Arct2-2 TaxID=2568653 RepID=UPI0010A4710D|nr:DUF423 domain-containing protein [Deinococcus sp. Arct2-2]THF71936.1 DUF423 domain-containing protein [Deinococcus sp. Arct2-2]